MLCVLTDSTCQTAHTLCEEDKTCGWQLSELELHCNGSGQCQRDSCSQAVRRFSQFVDQKLVEDLTFCRCAAGDTQCSRLQQLAFPSCLYASEGGPPRSCLDRWRQCDRDVKCRPWKQRFVQNCKVGERSGQCESPDLDKCRQAMLGIRGTPLEGPCYCASSHQRCAVVQRSLLPNNPCVQAAISQYQPRLTTPDPALIPVTNEYGEPDLPVTVEGWVDVWQLESLTTTTTSTPAPTTPLATTPKAGTPTQVASDAGADDDEGDIEYVDDVVDVDGKRQRQRPGKIPDDGTSYENIDYYGSSVFPPEYDGYSTFSMPPPKKPTTRRPPPTRPPPTRPPPIVTLPPSPEPRTAARTRQPLPPSPTKTRKATVPPTRAAFTARPPLPTSEELFNGYYTERDSNKVYPDYEDRPEYNGQIEDVYPESGITYEEVIKCLSDLSSLPTLSFSSRMTLPDPCS